MSETPTEFDAVYDSILNSIKKLNQIPVDYDVYDVDMVMYINSAFGDLADLGIGPEGGFDIQGPEETWMDFLVGTDLSFSRVKNYISFKVRLAFDPPQTGYHVTALKEQIKELEWRLNTQRELTAWTPPEAIA